MLDEFYCLIIPKLQPVDVCEWISNLVPHFTEHMITYPCLIESVLTHCGLVTIWRHKSGSTLAQVMACCLTAPSHYLNQCWLIIGKVQWHSFECNFTRDTSAISHWNYLENYLSKILFKSPRDRWGSMSLSSLQINMPNVNTCSL